MTEPIDNVSWVEHQALRAERDRLRGENEQLESDNRSLSEVVDELDAERDRLAAENTGLGLTLDGFIAFHSGHVLPDGLAKTQARARELSENPQPLTQAVQRVLEAVGVHEDATKRCKAAIEASSMSEVVGSPIFHELGRANDGLTVAHDALQALLEGRSES